MIPNLIAAGAIALATTSTVSADEEVLIGDCYTGTRMTELIMSWGEVILVSQMKTQDGMGLFLLWMTPSQKTWTLVSVSSGMSCVIAFGKDIEIEFKDMRD